MNTQTHPQTDAQGYVLTSAAWLLFFSFLFSPFWNTHIHTQEVSLTKLVMLFPPEKSDKGCLPVKAVCVNTTNIIIFAAHISTAVSHVLLAALA